MRKYYILNIVLFFLACYLGYELYLSATTPYLASAVKAEKQAVRDNVRTVGVKNAKDADHVNTVNRNYQLIVQNDLFRQTRKAPEKGVQPGDQQVLPPRLIGTINTPKGSVAYFEAADARSQKAYRVNDIVSGFTLMEIDLNKVVLQRGEQKVVLDLNDVKKIDKRQGRRTAPVLNSTPTVPMTTPLPGSQSAAPIVRPQPVQPPPPPPPADVPPRKGT
ncbi:MAG: hypothetical protein RBT37_09785 [Dissulfurispiraceae bacterium]|jgi:hypothetical protein|nr:hypothetical protein [Dissulfurispiraceae bacterium]